MRRRNWLIIFAASLAIFAAYAVLTGGIQVVSHHDFGGQQNVELHPGLKADIWLAPHSTDFSIPFVFHRLTTRVPCEIRLQIWDDSQQIRSIRIDEIVLEHPGTSEVQSHAPAWQRTLKPHRQVNSSSQGLIYTDVRALSERIPVRVVHHENVEVTLVGELETMTGEQLPFKTRSSFRAQRYFRVMTFWQRFM